MSVNEDTIISYSNVEGEVIPDRLLEVYLGDGEPNPVIEPAPSVSRALSDIALLEFQSESSSISDIINCEVGGLVAAIRQNGQPRSVIHALILEDSQSVEELSAGTGLDSHTVEQAVNALKSIGWIQSHQRKSGVWRFSLAWDQPTEPS